ncbi:MULTISPECIES: hypothetical protein [unclassified Rhizobium]|uniref:hypothetical protein n=1 Tax=unclassified Rhizobium TaxID=2613769 RepID=UPI0007EA993F|nr:MULTISPECIES: hypothetical protein [unclassified Rhizobium]ANM09211.1 hypothetical protein AMK05_CH00782 [Rhizobium sp. N324]OYD02779.1 hypothetical protein AMK08_CH100778 [Rhizobium sp. N4311]
MSLLSDTNYSPQRIYALLRLLGAQGGQLGFDSIRTWLKPAMRGIEQKGSEENTNIRQLLGATASLELIETPSQNQYKLAAAVPPTIEAFADAVHDRLVGLDMSHPDSVVLEAFAAMVVLTEAEQGTSWLDLNAKDRAAKVNDAMRASETNEDDDEKKRFNATKSSPWKRWMIFLGLGVPMPKSDLYPYPAQRLEREIRRLQRNETTPDALEVEVFISKIAERMPYLDSGRLFLASADRLRLPPLDRRISRVLSNTLRDLHDDKRLVLDAIGDAKEIYTLTQEPHPVRHIKAITLQGQINND